MNKIGNRFNQELLTGLCNIWKRCSYTEHFNDTPGSCWAFPGLAIEPFDRENIEQVRFCTSLL